MRSEVYVTERGTGLYYNNTPHRYEVGSRMLQFTVKCESPEDAIHLFQKICTPPWDDEPQITHDELEAKLRAVLRKHGFTEPAHA